jgi:hypothetical protein
MINLLIKIADSLDKKGLHIEATQVDQLIRKIAKELEEDFSKSSKDIQEDDAKDFPDLDGDEKVTKKDVLIGQGVLNNEGNPVKESSIDEAYNKVIKKRTKKS